MLFGSVRLKKASSRICPSEIQPIWDPYEAP
jgi:hypothetical protein